MSKKKSAKKNVDEVGVQPDSLQNKSTDKNDSEPKKFKPIIPIEADPLEILLEVWGSIQLIQTMNPILTQAYRAFEAGFPLPLDQIRKRLKTAKPERELKRLNEFKTRLLGEFVDSAKS